eukprot:TRINITY_DN1642_c0_g1_i2.p4 TRINITY_DN1642_c0_g1~~TRINITY_DN1642_c0_g1_i2.p4  ORF type:complete len:145 (+),score=5.09 TRINITY_DN1642_c0_g1_i2:654-1088(+)
MYQTHFKNHFYGLSRYLEFGNNVLLKTCKNIQNQEGKSTQFLDFTVVDFRFKVQLCDLPQLKRIFQEVVQTNFHFPLIKGERTVLGLGFARSSYLTKFSTRLCSSGPATTPRSRSFIASNTYVFSFYLCSTPAPKTEVIAQVLT